MHYQILCLRFLTLPKIGDLYLNYRVVVAQDLQFDSVEV